MPADCIIDAVAALCEAFGRTATEVTVGAYEIGLRGLTDQQVSTAAGMALQRCRFMPAPSELREMALTNGQGYEHKAQQAFIVAEKAARQHRGCRIAFHDSAITATVRTLGGLHKMPKSGTEAAVFYRKEFIETYRRLSVSGFDSALAKALPAVIDHEGAQPQEILVGCNELKLIEKT